MIAGDLQDSSPGNGPADSTAPFILPILRLSTAVVDTVPQNLRHLPRGPKISNYWIPTIRERVNLFVYGVVMFGGYRYLLTRSG